MSSYRFEEYYFDDVLFKNVDMTYIVHLENNGRINSVKNQIDKFKPSTQCKILYNKGYKIVNKPNLPEQTSTHDLVDSYLHIMKDAKNNNFQNILILEDDFFFDNNVRQYTNDIDNFIAQNDYEIYTLGTIPFILYPCDVTFKHYRYLLKGGSHAMIYNSKFIDRTLNTPQNKIPGWDAFTNTTGGYCYHTSLCYQLFPATENRNNWEHEIKTSAFMNEFAAKMIAKLLLLLISLFNLDKSETPGYFIAYLISKVLFLLFIAMVIYFTMISFMKVLKLNYLIY